MVAHTMYDRKRVPASYCSLRQCYDFAKFGNSPELCGPGVLELADHQAMQFSVISS
jgi:hypothetical protein